MKRILLLTLFIVFYTTVSFAQILCPDAADDAISVKGPHIKTNQKNITVVTCRYFKGKKLKGLVVGKYSKSYKFGQDICKSIPYREAEVRSEEVQAFVMYKNIRKKDNYTSEYWEILAEDLLVDITEAAIPCGTDKKMFKRPMDIRNAK